MSHHVEAEEEERLKWSGRAVGGARAGEFAQTRFKLIPDAHLNRETIAGVRDMNLGRVRKTGEPVGAPTIRFDTGQNTGTHPHINIDPKGRPSRLNPHIEVPPGVVKAAKIIDKTLKYGGIVLTVAAVAVDSWRIYNAVTDDIYIRDHAKEIIEQLEDAIRKLHKMLEGEYGAEKRNEIWITIEHLEQILKHVRRVDKLKLPVRTIKTASSVGGGWGGGLAGGAGGAWAGAQGGAALGALLGPVGAVVGAPLGAVVGAIGGGICAGMLGSAAGEAAAEAGLELAERNIDADRKISK